MGARRFKSPALQRPLDRDKRPDAAPAPTMPAKPLIRQPPLSLHSQSPGTAAPQLHSTCRYQIARRIHRSTSNPQHCIQHHHMRPDVSHVSDISSPLRVTRMSLPRGRLRWAATSVQLASGCYGQSTPPSFIVAIVVCESRIPAICRY